MESPSKPFDKTVHLSDRRLARVTGPDAASFLQNIMTNDIRQADATGLVYSCLLSPQGQFLHDFFVVKAAEGYLVDVDTARIDDLLRRMGIFKLRAKVTIEPLGNNHRVYTGGGLADPRHPLMGKRQYGESSPAANASFADYADFGDSLGVPASSAFAPSKDVVADVNLDLLNAVAWDKGCFIGQEVTARMRYKASAKKRLLIVTGEGLKVGDALFQQEAEIGQLRQVTTTGTQGLAVARLSALEKADNKIVTPSKHEVFLGLPEYIGNR